MTLKMHARCCPRVLIIATMHVHVGSAVNSFGMFVSVVLIGTLWRLVSAHLAVMDGRVGSVGRAMSFQY